MHSLTAYQRRMHAEAMAEYQRQRAREAAFQFAREHPVGTTVAVAGAALLFGIWLASRD